MSAVEEFLVEDHGDSPLAEPPLTPDAGGSLNGLQNGDDDDLFGDGSEPDLEQTQLSQRKLDDSELDSGDDEGRADRTADRGDEDEEEEDAPPLRMMSTDLARVNYPEGEDLYMLNLPPFLGLRHKNFDYDTYEPPKKPHDEDEARKFSQFSTAMTTMFWRRDPMNEELLQSNARVVKWSDGSMTLQFATKPNDHYRIEPKGVRQAYTAKHSKQASSLLSTRYDPSKDAHMFLAASQEESGVSLQIIRPIDASLKILPSGDLADESVKRLKASLAAVKDAHDPLARLKTVEEDPEIAKKAAEAFEKEKVRTQRKREAAEDRLMSRREKVLGRSGYGGGRSAGLSIAGLEADDDGMPSTYGKTKVKRRRTNNPRGEIYSDDEDPGMPRGRGDDYDRDDGFLASSDEEPETYEDGDDEILDDDDPDHDDLEIEGRETVVQNRTRGGADKGRRNRPRMDEIEGESDAEAEEDDAEAEPDTELLTRQASAASQGSPGGVASGGAGRKRRVIDDDDDDE